MIYVVRTVRPEPGKMKELLDWAMRVVRHWRKYSGVKSLELCRPLSGERELIRWLGKYDSLSAWEKTVAESQADAAFQKLVQESKGIQVPGLTDTFYEIRE